MFGKIISIFEQNIKLENLSKRVETTLVGVHIVFEDKFKVVAEITSITRDEISCILVGEFINNVFMTMLTYATPLFWELSMIPDRFVWIFKLNPLCDIITFVREIVLYNSYPGTELAVLSLIIPVVFLVIGIHVFRKNQDKFILYI